MFSNRDKADCAKREVSYRMFVYSKKVNEGKMSQRQADQQIGLMREIYEDYDRLAEAEDKASRLL